MLRNPVQEYSWGSRMAIQDLLGEPCPHKGPVAELWMGAHPKACSSVLVRGEWEPLDKIIEMNPESVLGRAAARRFSGKLPFLFKVLAVDSPLSLQVHPNLEQALKGFDRERGLGIPSDAPERNYRDENHKPEILCALTPFEVMTGFRTINEILGLMEKVSCPSLSNELARFMKSPDIFGLKSFLADLMGMEEVRRRLAVGEAARLAKQFAGRDPAFGWMVKLNQAYPGDAGVFSPLFLNLMTLAPGEAIYVRAGEVHAYLHGFGIELMANSDNVVRAGLTAKHVDIPEFLKIAGLRNEPGRAIRPVISGPCKRIYETPAQEFQLSVITVDKDDSFISPSKRSAEILLCLRGNAVIKDLGRRGSVAIGRGGSVIVPSAVPGYRIKGDAIFYKASVPVLG